MKKIRKFLCLAMVAVLLINSSVIVFGKPVPEASIEDSVNLTIGSGKLKIQAYANDIVRVRFSPDGVFVPKDFDDDKYINTFVDPSADLKPVDLSIADSDGFITASTTKLDIKIDKTTGAASFYDKSGNLVLAEKNRSSNPVTVNGQVHYTVTQNFASPSNERLYGFGNVNDRLGIKGEAVEIRQTNTGKRAPMFVSNLGYGILFDITSNGRLGWADSNATYSYTGNATDSMDYYFFYGPESDGVIAGYREVTGRATLLPKNTFGYVQSRNRYSSQSELISIVDQFRAKQIPLDHIIIDYYWWNGGFNNIMEPSSSFNDLSGTMNNIHGKNVSSSISIWPSFDLGNTTSNYLQTNYPGMIVPTSIDPGGGFGGRYYDPSKDEFRKAYWTLIENYVFNQGLDSIWLDACEPEMGNWASNTSTVPVSYGNARAIGAIYPLLTNKGVYEGQRAIPTNTKRVNSLSRGATAGTQRYGIQSWSGDIGTGFNVIRNEIKGVANYSAAGLPFFSTDTGGYFTFNSSNENDREMFLRWLEWSAFTSIMRVHGENAGGSNNREPWQFGGEYEKYITSYINLRERLIPYVYTLAGKVTKDHYSMVRPLVFDFRTDVTALDIQDQYMFGPAFLVSPVYTQGQRVRNLYLPEGKWIDFWTGVTTESAGQYFNVDAPLDKMPLQVRAGSIVPMGPFIQYATESADPTELRVYTGADGTFTLYEDEGNNYNYENGAYSEIEFQWNESAKKLTIGNRAGSFNGMLQNRTFNIVFVQPGYGIGVDLSSKYQASVAYDGTEASIDFNPDWQPPLPPIDPDTLPKPDPAPKPLTVEKAMVGEWLFEEGEGLRLKDTSGHFNDAGLVTSATNVWREGKQGLSLNYTGGENTYAQIKDSDSLHISNEISFASWIYPQSGSSDWRFIVAKGGHDVNYNGNNPGFCLMLQNNSNNRLQLEIQSPKNASGVTTHKLALAMTSGSIPYNQWSHVAFTWKGTDSGGDGIIRLYVNGQIVATGAFAGPVGINTESMNIGRNSPSNSYALCFNGSIDEARLFNYALLDADIEKIVNMQRISAYNPGNINVTPGDGSITVNWDDPNEPLLDSIRVQCTPESGGETLSLTVPKGVKTLTIPGLTNETYYQILLQTVLSDGSKSEGIYAVGMAGRFKARIEVPVSYDTDVYGYILNNTGHSLTGTLRVDVIQGTDPDPVHTAVLNNFTVSGLDMLQFKADIGPYADNQTIQISYLDELGADLAEIATVRRRGTIPPINPDTLPKPDVPPVPLATDSGMVGEWLFDEGSGTVLSDTSGHLNHGALVSSASNLWREGKAGTALNYTGGGTTFVEIANSQSLQIANEITYAAWINPQSGQTNYRFIMSKGGNDSNRPGYCLLLQNNGNNRLQLEIQTPFNGAGNTTKSTISATTNIPYGQWTHIAFTWKGTAVGGDNVARLYINGAQAGSGNFAGPIGVNTEPLNIGRNSTNNTGYPLCFYGSIDEARLFNYALTTEEIGKLANMQSVTARNPQNINAVPLDGGIAVTWDDPAEALLEKVLITCTPDDGGDTKVYNAAKGIQAQTISGLENGKYYHIFLQTILSDGTASDGVYIVGKAAAYKANLEYTLTHDNKVYGYAVNNTLQSLTGTIVADVYREIDNVLVQSIKVENFDLNASDMRQFIADLSEYADGQLVKVSYIDSNGDDLAKSFTIKRKEIYDGTMNAALWINDNNLVFSNATNSNINAQLILAVYSADGTLAYAEQKLASILAHSDKTVAFDIDLRKYEGCMLKGFAWDDNYTPITAAAVK